MNVTSIESERHARWRVWALVGGVGALIVMLGLMLGSVRQTSLTFDELPHVAGGAAIVQRGDFRLQAENGVLPQWLAGWALQDYALPPVDHEGWREGDGWGVGFEWLYESGHNADVMAWRARLACALLAVLLGAVVWVWARRLFGVAGGLLALALYALSPTILANGPLVASDLAAALFFTASVATIWALAHRVSAARVLACGLSVGLLFLSKMSALLVLPMAVGLVALKGLAGEPLRVGGERSGRQLDGRLAQVAGLAGAGVVVAVLAWAIVWTGYGWRFSVCPTADRDHVNFPLPWEFVLEKPTPDVVLRTAGLNAEQREDAARFFRERGAEIDRWTNASVETFAALQRARLDAGQQEKAAALLAAPSPRWTLRVLGFLRQHEWMPEAWIYGTAHVLRQTQGRVAFFDGEVKAGGWRWFFPYVFAVKTPLLVLAIGGLALAAALVGRSGREIGAAAYACAPLLVLAVGYGAIAVASAVNIGHRHLLPIYPAIFVLCGAAVRWIDRRGFAVALAAAVGLLAAETVWRYPHYLAYFNGVVTPRQAYRHLVDSSLDWGQDLPSVGRYLAAHRPTGPVYFSYFGTASPGWHGVEARPLYSFFGVHQRRSPAFTRVRLPAATAAAQLAAFERSAPDYEVMSGMRADEDVIVELLKRPPALRLEAGTYLVSATMLQSVHFVGADAPLGRWNEGYEATYRGLLAEVRALLNDDPAVRHAGYDRHAGETWAELWRRFDEYRFARLAAWLQAREPKDEIGGTVLVYELSAADLAQALEGPTPTR